MASMLSSSKESDLIIHIGSGSVSGAVAELKKNTRPMVFHTHESQFPVTEGISPSLLANSMLSALQTVLKVLHDEHRKKIVNVHIVFTSPWTSIVSKSFNTKKPAAFTVDQKTIDSLVTEQVNKIFKDIQTEDFVLLEKAISHIKINGYETSQPIGKTAKTLDVSIYASMVNSVVHDKIESEIYTAIHPKKIFFHTLPFVARNVIEPLFSPKEDFTFIDIGSEITDVLIIRRGSISSLVSFPVGKNHLVRRAAIAFETHPELAQSLISLYASDSADEGTKEKMRSIASAFGEEWTSMFTHSIQDNHEGSDNFFPQKAFFVSGQAVLPIFNDIITKQIPSTVALSRDNVSQFVDFSTKEPPNIFLALNVIYLYSQFTGGEIVYKQDQSQLK